MKTIAATLGVFLGASLLLNAVLASRRAGDVPPAAPPSPPPAAAPGLATQLARERQEKEALRDRLAALEKLAEAAPTAVAPPPPPAPAVASERDKLRSFVRKMLQAKKTPDAAPMDPEELAEMSSFLMAYYPALLSPSSDPAKFAGFLAGTLEITAEETGVGLSPEQKGRFDGLTRALIDGLSSVPQGSAVERLLGELQAQKGFIEGLSSVMTPAQEAKLQEHDMLRLDGFGQSRSFSGVQDGALVKSVVDDWSKLLSLDDAQRQLADASAQRFVQDLRRLAPVPGDSAARSLDYRIEALRAQKAALDALTGSLTDAQRRQLLKKGVWEYRLFPSQPAQK